MAKSSRFKHAAHAAWRMVGSDAVVLDLDSGVYYSLNEVGVLIWEKIGEGLDLDAIEAEICRVYEVPAKSARKDLEDLIADLRKQKLLIAA